MPVAETEESAEDATEDETDEELVDVSDDGLSEGIDVDDPDDPDDSQSPLVQGDGSYTRD